MSHILFKPHDNVFSTLLSSPSHSQDCLERFTMINLPKHLRHCPPIYYHCDCRIGKILLLFTALYHDFS